MRRPLASAFALALLSGSAVAAAPNPCTLPGVPIASLCYGTVQLADDFAGPAIEVRRPSDQVTQGIPIAADGNLDTRTLDAFLANDSFGEVTKRHNQTAAGRDATTDERFTLTGDTTIGATTISGVSSAAGLRKGMALISGPSGPFPRGTRILNFTADTITVYDFATKTQSGETLYAATSLPPRIKELNIGGARSVIYEGGSRVGQVFGHTLPPMAEFGCTGQTYTSFTVIRATSSMYRNQSFTPGLGSGAVLSLEGSATIQFTGDTTAGVPAIRNIVSISSIAPGMRITSGPSGPFPLGVLVGSVDGGTITVVGANAITDATAEGMNATLPLARIYSNGDAGPGSWSVSDDSAFTLEPQDTMIEIAPVVLTVSSDATGVRIRQNEIIRSTASRSALSTTATTGYIGRLGSSVGGPFSKAGDFHDVAQIVFCTTLTEEQASRVRSALYQRFGIHYRGSEPSAKNLIVVGDSIPAGYGTPGLHGMVSRLQEMLPGVRIGNYAVPGSQITPAAGVPFYGYTQGMYGGSVAAAATYSKSNNVVLVLGGGNDMVSELLLTTTVSTASPAVVTAVAHGMPVNGRVEFRTTGSLPSPLKLKTTYYVKTVLSPDTFTIAAAPGGTAIDTSGDQSGAHTARLFPKTSASIMAGIQSVVDQAIAAGTQKVFVATVLPRVGSLYHYILPDLNALIMAGGSGNYTPVNLYVDPCLATIPGPCFADNGGHPSSLGHQTAASALYPIIRPYLDEPPGKDLAPAGNENLARSPTAHAP